MKPETTKVRFPAAIAPDGRWAVSGRGVGGGDADAFAQAVEIVLDDVDYTPRSAVRVVTVEVTLTVPEPPAAAVVKGRVSDAP